MSPLRPVGPILPRFTSCSTRSGTRTLSLLMTWLILTVAAAPDRVSAETAAPSISDTLKVTLAAPAGGTVDEGETGHFEVSVTGSTAEGAVTVRYSVSGTAVAGEDYTALSGEVAVARGESPAIQVRVSRFRGAFQQGPVQRQETQIVQPCKTLDDSLP